MRARVLKAAQDLGYQPNHLARSLITGKSGIVGVVIGNPRNTFHLEALDALSARLSAAGLYLQVFTARAAGHADELVEALLRFRADALLLMSTELSERLAAQCQKIALPVICFNRQPQWRGDSFTVTAANHRGASQVAGHLLEQGYTRPAIITASDHSATSREREAGFLDTLGRRGLPAPLRTSGGHGAGAVPAVRHLLSLPEPPDAIFCTSDYMAMAAIETARFEFGLEIGPQLGIAGFDDTEGAAWRSFDLTSYSQPIRPMIEQVSRIILEPETLGETREFVIEGELKVRASTRRAKG